MGSGFNDKKKSLKHTRKLNKLSECLKLSYDHFTWPWGYKIQPKCRPDQMNPATDPGLIPDGIFTCKPPARNPIKQILLWDNQEDTYIQVIEQVDGIKWMGVGAVVTHEQYW